MRRQRRTKIVATLGPASGTAEMVDALFRAGADVFRLNFSHGTHDDHKRVYDIIRAVEADHGRPIAVLADLQGPKLRLGTFADGPITLEEGDPFRLDLDETPGDQTRAPLLHPEIFAAIEPGALLLVDDGKMRLRVERCDADHAETVAETAGTLSDRKGVNVPGTVLPISALTEKDRRDLTYALKLGADWVAQSFVQRPEDVAELRKLIGGKAAIMVKLEKPAAIDRLAEIIDLCDGMMVARGDLGVELPPEDVPVLQKEIVHRCRVAGKPVVVATQMLESMIHVPTPTRAEASDVATAVYDGADAVMLSAESAAGDYPVEAVAMMNRIVERVEHASNYRHLLQADHANPEATASDAITAAAHLVATTVSAVAIVTYTTSGSTALRASRERPPVDILGLTPNPATARRLVMAWGVHCIETEDATGVTDMVGKACRLAKDEGFAAPGDILVITAGVPFGTPGATNLLRIAHVWN